MREICWALGNTYPAMFQYRAGILSHYIIHILNWVSVELNDETAPEKSDELAARMKERVSFNCIVNQFVECIFTDERPA